MDYASYMQLPDPVNAPAKLATALGFYDMIIYEILPAFLAIIGKRF